MGPIVHNFNRAAWFLPLFTVRLGTVVSDRIIADPNILGGNPVVRGTRLSVELLLTLLDDGW